MQVLAVGSLSKSDPPLWMQNAGYNSWKIQQKKHIKKYIQIKTYPVTAGTDF